MSSMQSASSKTANNEFQSQKEEFEFVDIEAKFKEERGIIS